MLSSAPGTGTDAVPEVDPQRPSMSRLYDYYLGGRHHFAADRQAAAAALAAMPQLPRALRANRAFLRRAVTAAAESGVDQFLELGAGIPGVDNVHEVARSVRPAARVVYVDLEPVAVVHTRRVLGDDPDAGCLLADLTDADAVLGSALVHDLIDLDRPVALLLCGVAHYIPDTERLGRALERYREAVAPGSLLAVSHGTGVNDPGRADRVRRVYNDTISPMVLRDADEIRALFGDWTLLDPGLVAVAEWRPRPDEPDHGDFARRAFFAGVAGKP